MIEAMQMGLVQAPTAVPAVAAGGFDLTTVLASFGASVPLFLWLLKMHRDLITIVIPRGFRLIRREMIRQGDESKIRHSEHVELMKKVAGTLVGQRRDESSKGRRNEDTPRRSSPQRRTAKKKKKNARRSP